MSFRTVVHPTQEFDEEIIKQQIRQKTKSMFEITKLYMFVKRLKIIPHVTYTSNLILLKLRAIHSNPRI